MRTLSNAHDVILCYAKTNERRINQLFVKASDTRSIDLTVEEGLKVIISGGMIGPENIDIK